MEKSTEISRYDILWHNTFSGQYEIKNSIEEPVENKNIILLDSTFNSISTPIEASGNTQILCIKCTFDKCTENRQRANGIHSTCLGLCIKLTVCTGCIQSGNFRAFVYHSAQTKNGKFIIDICDISSCISKYGSICSVYGLFITKSMNTSSCTADYETAIKTDSTNTGSFHRFDILVNNIANEHIIFTLEENINEMRDCIFSNNSMKLSGTSCGILQTHGSSTDSKIERCVFEGNSGEYIIASSSTSKMVLTSCYIQSDARTLNVEIKDSISKENVLHLISKLKVFKYTPASQKQSAMHVLIAILSVNLI